MRIALYLKPSILQDARLTRCPHSLNDTFDGRSIIFREEHGRLVAYFHGWFTTPIHAGLYDHVHYTEVEDSFACQAIRRQGRYRHEGVGGDASATLERVPWSTMGKHRSPSREERARALAGEADYSVLIRASNLKIAEELYLAIRRGAILPADDWDKEQVSKA